LLHSLLVTRVKTVNSKMIVLFSDFGLHGPYIGQVKAVLHKQAPQQPVIDLISDAPVYDVRCSAYLLAAYVCSFPAGTVFCAVVDPGVGSEREAVMIEAAGQWFVGPDNGLFARVAAVAATARCWRIDWRPQQLSATFHGRDLFAPVAAQLALGERPEASLFPEANTLATQWSDDYAAVIYIDHFGNAMTGIRATSLSDEHKLQFRDAAGEEVILAYARNYARVTVGQAFWYRNANGLIEIAVNQGHAGQRYGLKPGVVLTIQAPC